jgi:predicted dehydrogenase
MTLRAAVVGCGRIGSAFDERPGPGGVQTHAGAYARHPGTELVALVDPDRARLRAAARAWGVGGAHRDVRAMLRSERPDLVSVCTPDATHAGVLRAVLKAPGVRGVLAEKPLALTVRQAAELVRLARRRGVVLAVNYTRRFAPSHQRVRRLVASGALGPIQVVHGYYTKGVAHNGTHWFDLARWLLGDVRRVRASRGGAGGSDPTLDVELAFASGARGLLHGLDARHHTLFEMDLVGTRGRLRLLEGGQRFERFDVRPSPHYPGYRVLRPRAAPAAGLDDVLLHAVADLVQAVGRGRAPACSGADALAALAVAEAARISVRTGRAVAPRGPR